MAKVKPGNIAPEALPRVRGEFLVRTGKSGPVAQKWPRKRTRAPSPGEWYHQTEFGMIARNASDPEPIMYQSAIELVKGSDLVPRDALMKTMMGLWYEITEIEGVTPTYYRMVAANAQLTLDQITDTPGALLWRSPSGWLGIEPGSNGQYLAMNGTVPEWQNAQLASGGAANIAAPYLANADVYITPGASNGGSFTNIATNANQLWITPFTVPWAVDVTKMAISVAVLSGTAGATGRLGVYAMRPTDGQPLAPLIDAGTVSITSTGLKTVAIAHTLAPGTYFMAWWASANCSVRGASGGAAVVGTGVRLLPTTIAQTLTLRKTITYAAALPDLSSITMDIPSTTDGYPMAGIK